MASILKLRSRTGRQLALGALLLVASGSTAFALGVFPGSFKFADGGKAVRKRPANMNAAIVQNNGPDVLTVSSKGESTTTTMTVLVGEKLGMLLPDGAKNVKLVDANVGDGAGVKGFVLWAKKLPNTPGHGGGGTGNQ